LESGANLFQDYCAQCHGADGRGGGQLVQDRLQPLPNLRELNVRNAGAFPFQRIVETVTGNVEVDMHGERFMPAWGEVFRFKEENGDALAHARILNLTWYLSTIQDD
jgi:mono/diheme cytochrome c family protein